MNLQYLIFWTLTFGTFAWVLVRTLKRVFFPPDSDDEGGIPTEHNLPIYDPPSGRTFDELLVDRPPKGFPNPSPNPRPEKTGNRRG